MDEVLDIRAVSGDVDPANLALLRPAMEQAVARRAVQRDPLVVGGTDRLCYTSDAVDDFSCVSAGGRRIT